MDVNRKKLANQLGPHSFKRHSTIGNEVPSTTRPPSPHKMNASKLPTLAVLVALLCATTSTLSSVTAMLSVPVRHDKKGTRADAIAELAARIKNEPRTTLVGDEEFPFYNGPIVAPGSLAEQLQTQEVGRLRSVPKDRAAYVAARVGALVQEGNLTSMDAIASIYDQLTEHDLVMPVTVNHGDANFGRERTTVFAMRLRQVMVDEYCDTNLELSDAQLSEICGCDTTWTKIRQQGELFVEDYSDVAQWNDPAQPTKYVPNVVGIFCFNRGSEKLLPVVIEFPDSKLAYSRYDTADEWTLAKMALNVASLNYHQFLHYADTHAISVPIRVELYRNMATEHPVAALLHHHGSVDFGLEALLQTLLLEPDTAVDRSFGWGATGATRFLAYQLQHVVSLSRGFYADVNERGLRDISNHAYVANGEALHEIIATFLSEYLDAFYTCDRDVQHDWELQHWARACSKVPHLRGFPAHINSLVDLHELLTVLVFKSAAKHHAMNGEASWHAAAVPYSPMALWKPLPTAKPAASLNLLEYTTPISRLPEALALVASFYLPLTTNQTLLQAYRAAPFRDEPCLQPAIQHLEASLTALDEFIHREEEGFAEPYEVLRPSHLPFNSWI